MFQIDLENISKRFVREWIIKGCNYSFESGNAYAITGPNGSGKSSFAQLLTGYSTPTSGKITFRQNNEVLEVEKVYQYLSFASPYMELIEEFTLMELLNFHFKMRAPLQNVQVADLPELIQLSRARDKEIRNFSSGMKQRLKLGLAFYTKSELIILDEPTTNLDETGVQWYLERIEEFTKDKVLIVCSNQEREYQFCNKKLSLLEWK